MKKELFSLGPVTIHSYGLMIALGFLFCVILAYFRAKKRGEKHEAIIDIALYGIIAGFIGAKLLFVIVEFKDFLKDPLSVLGSSGFVVYGGIILGVLAGYIYCKVKKLNFLTYFDLATPSIALAQGFGRMGCFLAGCCYGRQTDAWYGVTFPADSFGPTGVKVIPTQLFSSIGDWIIMAILLLYARKEKQPGCVGALYMILYGVGRFAIEFLRSDDRGAVGALSTSQLISIFIVAGGIALMTFLKVKAKK